MTGTPSGARPGDTVAISYTGMLDDGTVFDTNENGTSLRFVFGLDNIILGLQEGLIGMTKDPTKTIHILPDKVYGPYRNELVQALNRSGFSTDTSLELGRLYTIRRSDGAVSIIKVLNVTVSAVTVDENHELASKNLPFIVRLVDIDKK